MKKLRKPENKKVIIREDRNGNVLAIQIANKMYINTQYYSKRLDRVYKTIYHIKAKHINQLMQGIFK